jgi:hypothetical protein
VIRKKKAENSREKIPQLAPHFLSKIKQKREWAGPTLFLRCTPGMGVNLVVEGRQVQA